jgi:hypothetical protein
MAGCFTYLLPEILAYCTVELMWTATQQSFHSSFSAVIPGKAGKRSSVQRVISDTLLSKFVRLSFVADSKDPCGCFSKNANPG